MPAEGERHHLRQLPADRRERAGLPARPVVAQAVEVDVVARQQDRPVVEIVLVPEVIAVDPAGALLADRHMLEARQVAIAAVVERAEPDVEHDLLPFVVRVGLTTLPPEMLARGLQRQAGADRIEQGQQLARLRGRGVLGLGLIEPVVVEQAAAEVVGEALALGDPDLGEQAVIGRPARRARRRPRSPGPDRRACRPGSL